MGKINDLAGKKFGKLKVLKFVAIDKNHKALFLCKCDCGKRTTVIGSRLVSGNTTSCSCYKLEESKQPNPERRKFNKYDLSGEYGIGYTTKGEEFYFDLEDYDKIKDYCWRIHRGYV